MSVVSTHLMAVVPMAHPGPVMVTVVSRSYDTSHLVPVTSTHVHTLVITCLLCTYTGLPLTYIHFNVAGDTEAAQAPGESLTVRWDLVSLGVVGTLLVLSILVIVGIGLYYKHKYRQRKRR